MHLINSSRLAIRTWAQELHNYRKNVKDRDAYMSQLKDLHSKVACYHSIECEGKPPTSCAWSCDIWKLLHLCLYLMEENQFI